MDTPCAFRIGTNRTHVILSPRRGEQREGKDCSDSWIDADVEVAAAAFHGSFAAQARAWGLARFRAQLRPLYTQLSGRAVFTTDEAWLLVEIVDDGKGHFHASRATQRTARYRATGRVEDAPTCAETTSAPGVALVPP